MPNQIIHELKETRKRTLETLERVKELDENDSDRIFFEKQLKSRIKFIDKLLKENQNEAKKMGQNTI